MHARLASAVSERTLEGWAFYERGGTAEPLQLDAAAVDVPTCAASVCPAEIVDPAIRPLLTDASRIFPAVPGGLERFSGFFAGSREQYVALTVRQLRAGLLELASDCKGGGTVFPVGKSRGRQRVVWHGTRVSEAAAKPPALRHLANPAVFGFLSLSSAERLRVSKRDGRSWFDQLALDPCLRPFFGRPGVKREELLEAGMSEAELVAAAGADSARSWLVPRAMVWPMGFSWSSWVAQETLLTIASRAGLTTAQVLACDA